MKEFRILIQSTDEGVEITIDRQGPIPFTAGNISFSKSGFSISAARADDSTPVLVEENQTARGYV